MSTKHLADLVRSDIAQHEPRLVEPERIMLGAASGDTRRRRLIGVAVANIGGRERVRGFVSKIPVGNPAAPVKPFP